MFWAYFNPVTPLDPIFGKCIHLNRFKAYLPSRWLGFNLIISRLLAFIQWSPVARIGLVSSQWNRPVNPNIDFQPRQQQHQHVCSLLRWWLWCLHVGVWSEYLIHNHSHSQTARVEMPIFFVSLLAFNLVLSQRIKQINLRLLHCIVSTPFWRLLLSDDGICRCASNISNSSIFVDIEVHIMGRLKLIPFYRDKTILWSSSYPISTH